MARALVFLTLCFMFSPLLANGKKREYVVVSTKSASLQPLRYNGVLQPAISIELMQPEQAILHKQYFANGDKVKKDQLLLEWSSTELLSQLYSARREYIESKEAVLKLTHWESSEAVLEASREADYAKQQYNDAKYRLEQTEKLYQAGIVSKEEYRLDKRNNEQARRNFEQALFSQKQITRKGNQEQKKLASMKYDIARKRYQTLSEQVKALMVYSPIDGIVIQKNAKEGEAFATLIGTTNWAVEINVSEKDAIMLQTGQEVTIQLRALENQKLTGKITNIGFRPVNNVEHEQMARYPITIKIVSTEAMTEQWLLGMSALVVCEFPKTEGLYIPKQAVTAIGEHYFVDLSFNDGTWARTKIKVVKINENEVQVTQGLKEGDNLVMFS